MGRGYSYRPGTSTSTRLMASCTAARRAAPHSLPTAEFSRCRWQRSCRWAPRNRVNRPPRPNWQSRFRCRLPTSWRLPVALVFRSSPVQRMESALKILGLVLAFAGIVTAFLDLRGVFDDKEKTGLTKLIHDGGGGIPRSTPGFEKFLKAFPPPAGVDPPAVTHIVLDRLVTH